VINDGDVPRELSGLVVPPLGSLEATGDLFQAYRVVDGDGAVVEPAAAFFAELTACGRPATTQRSYGMDLLRWFRFLWALGVDWDQATRVEARDFCRWLQVTVKPARPHWRYPAGGAPGSGTESAAARVNPVTGKPSRGDRYEAATVAHCESVLRGFYDFCAMRRSFISLAQRGEMGGISLEPMAYPAPKGNMGTVACQETSGHAQAYGVTR